MSAGALRGAAAATGEAGTPLAAVGPNGGIPNLAMIVSAAVPERPSAAPPAAFEG